MFLGESQTSLVNECRASLGMKMRETGPHEVTPVTCTQLSGASVQCFPVLSPSGLTDGELTAAAEGLQRAAASLLHKRETKEAPEMCVSVNGGSHEE